MIKASTILYFSGVQQDTLVKPQQPAPSIILRRPQLDLERAEGMMRQFEQREQEIEASQHRTVKPKPVKTLRAPSIEVDTVMARYRHIGCSPRANFPDTFTLTVLERYYQPMASAMMPITAIDSDDEAMVYPELPADTTKSQRDNAQAVLTMQDSVQTAFTATAVELPPISPGFATNPRQAGYPSSITLFLTGGLILLAIIKYNFGKNLLEAFRSFFSCRQAMRLIEERRESDRQAAVLSDILFTLITGIFVSVALPFFDLSPLWGSYTLSILFFTLATGLLYILRSWIWQILGVVFMTQPFSKIYIYNMFLCNRNTGLIIFPPVAVIPYIAETLTPYILYSVIAVFVLSYLLKLWRIFQIIHARNVSVFYFILYLCTLEILPFLLLAKSCKVLIESAFV